MIVFSSNFDNNHGWEMSGMGIVQWWGIVRSSSLGHMSGYFCDFFSFNFDNNHGWEMSGMGIDQR